MPKDTKSSGYNKAPACESRGFGHKKEGENFDTPSLKYALKENLRKRYKTATALRMLSNIADSLLSRRAVCMS